ncbi:unnamed protein product [Calicophoron daubneyi]|uniref:Actin interacting protein 3-like C-terminal domain-containing protein n=1 Tax=Calicophoron daubneyi TaxID=300641 RepID=A0AAV2T881_CALDB
MEKISSKTNIVRTIDADDPSEDEQHQRQSRPKMLPNQPQIPAPQRLNLSTVYRQPFVYIAVPAIQRAIPATTTTGHNASTEQTRVNGPPVSQNDQHHRNKQLCTCPPEVHKALLEGGLISQTKNKAEVSPNPAFFYPGSSNIRAVTPTQMQHTLAATVSRTTAQDTSVPGIALTVADLQRLNELRPSVGTQWILVPAATPNGEHYLIATPTSATSNDIPTPVEKKPPPDVLPVTTVLNQSSAKKTPATTPSSPTTTSPEAHVQLECVENQLAHLTAWVQVLQQPQPAAVNSKQLAGYLHRHCGANACRAAEMQTSLTSTDLSYTPSNSSLDSAYSARSTNSSDSANQNTRSTEDTAQKTHVVETTSPPVTRIQPLTVTVSSTRPIPPPAAEPSVHTQQEAQPVEENAVHPDYCQLVALPSYANFTQQLIGQHRAEMQLARHRLQVTQSEVLRMKEEIANLRRVQVATMAGHREAIDEVAERIKRMISQINGLDMKPLQVERSKVNEELGVYFNEMHQADSWLKDLDMAIEDLRVIALTRRCRISVTEVETLALHLNRISSRLRSFRDDFPKLHERIQRVIEAESKQIDRNRRLLQTEPERINEAIERCRQLTSTLFTLKRYLNHPVRTVFHHCLPEQTRAAEALQKCKKKMASPNVSKFFEEPIKFSSDLVVLPEEEYFAEQLRPSSAPSAYRMIFCPSESDTDPESERTPDWLLPDYNKYAGEFGIPPNNHISVAEQADNANLTRHTAVHKSPQHDGQVLPYLREAVNTSEPLSVEQDRTFVLCDPPKTSDNDQAGAKPKPPVKTGLASAPTILKRPENSSASSSSTNQGTQGRRSRVVFSRTVLVGNGSETTQLNCPSETDEDFEENPQNNRQFSFSLDDSVINRSSEPWVFGQKKNRVTDGLSSSSMYPNRRNLMYTSQTERLPHHPEKPVNFNFLARKNDTRGKESSNGEFGRKADTFSLLRETPPTADGSGVNTSKKQHHHYNCQAARQTTSKSNNLDDSYGQQTF